MSILPKDLTEDQAIDILIQLDQSFGWVSTVVNRETAEYAVGELTDDQWNRLRSSREWNNHLSDAINEGLIEVISEVVNRALPELEA
jgi:hypothetical protein